MKVLLIVPAFACLIGAGCASSLKTFNSESQPTVGIPISTPVLVKITSRTKFKPGPNGEKFAAYCMDEEDSEYKMLPLGERGYINFEAAQFGKSEFKVEFSDAGSLKVVSLNSDPSKALEEAGDFASAVLPFIASKKPSPAALADDPAQTIKDTHCVRGGTEMISVEKVNLASP